MHLSGNTVLITGGSSGIGLALARQFQIHNNRVIITGRDGAKLASAEKELPGIHTFRTDHTDPASAISLRDYISEHHPALNVLINNAGVQYSYAFGHDPASAGNIATETQINFIAPLLLTNALLPFLTGQPASAIVFVSSALYIAPKRSAPVYCATKAAIHTFAKALRYQLEGSSVKVFEIIPPLVDTAMTTDRSSSGKMSTDRLARIFIRNFHSDDTEQYIGKSRLLKMLSRISPRLAESMMKNG
ncbi:SDR family oxidoreductase [Chitinophaga sp. NPDC101104]|uniref:SDR family oxidoreductase n=1 Tax=Chitinophaga sp. NPDC101104 TaxID=3390561 RepID=UPI003D065AA9